MWTNAFETQPYGVRGLYFYEPLRTLAPREAKPHCCYVGTIIFYEQPYRLMPDGHSLAEFDRIETCWNMLGERWTEQDLGFASLAPLILHAGQIDELGGGQVVWRDTGWVMEWLGWRVDEFDRRWSEIAKRIPA